MKMKKAQIKHLIVKIHKILINPLFFHSLLLSLIMKRLLSIMNELIKMYYEYIFMNYIFINIYYYK